MIFMFYVRLMVHLAIRLTVYPLVSAITIGWFGAVEGAICAPLVIALAPSAAGPSVNWWDMLKTLLTLGAWYGAGCGAAVGIVWGALLGLVLAIAYARRRCSRAELLQLTFGALRGSLLGVGIVVILGGMAVGGGALVNNYSVPPFNWNAVVFGYGIWGIVGGASIGSAAGAWAHVAPIPRERMREMLWLTGPLPSLLFSKVLTQPPVRDLWTYKVIE